MWILMHLQSSTAVWQLDVPAFPSRCHRRTQVSCRFARDLLALHRFLKYPKDFLNGSRCLCVWLTQLTQLILHSLVNLQQIRIHLKDLKHAQQTRTKICRMLFSWFKLPMTWNAAAYHEEWKSTSEYPYFGCYLFHSFKNILKPWVVCPETKYAGSPVSQNFEIPAVQQQEWWKLQGDLTWHGVLHAGRLLALLSVLCPGTPDPGSVLEALLLVHQRSTDVITFQD